MPGWVSSRKHGLAMFFHEKFNWIFVVQSSERSVAQWLCVDIDGYKIVNVNKPPVSQLTLTAILVFLHPCLYAGDFNCHPTDWGYSYTNLDGKRLADWAAKENLFLYNPKIAPSFFSGRWNNRTNPYLAFANKNLNSFKLDKCRSEKFPRSQHQPSPIAATKNLAQVQNKSYKHWNFRKGTIRFHRKPAISGITIS